MNIEHKGALSKQHILQNILFKNCSQIIDLHRVRPHKLNLPGVNK